MTIKENTVLILGAGASIPYGFPDGDQLISQIIECAGTDNEIIEIAKKYNKYPQTFKLGVQNIREELIEDRPSSIDVFLAGREKDTQEVGKLLVEHSLVKFYSKNKFKNEEGQWYKELYKMLNFDEELHQFGNNKLSIISFNYDTSLDNFLEKRLKADYKKHHPDEVMAQLKRLPIFHIYGQIGQYQYDSTGQVISNGITLMGECNCMADVQNRLRLAERIVFIGFGYHKENLSILGLNALKACNHLQGTMYEVSNRIKNNIKEVFDGRLIGFDVDAFKFFKEIF